MSYWAYLNILLIHLCIFNIKPMKLNILYMYNYLLHTHVLYNNNIITSGYACGLFFQPSMSY